MTLKQLENLIEIDQDITDDAYGTYYDKRTIEQLLNYGIILLDKPPGPTSHETVAWTKRLLKLPKISPLNISITLSSFSLDGRE